MGWGGLDDKHFLGSRDAVGQLMKRVLPDYQERPEREFYYGPGNSRFPRNIETFYQRESQLLGIPVHLQPIDSVPIVTIRQKTSLDCYKATPDCLPCSFHAQFSTSKEALVEICPEWRRDWHGTHHQHWCECHSNAPAECHAYRRYP
ncbi:unnamed protein product [Chrysoparadoxa australica]